MKPEDLLGFELTSETPETPADLDEPETEQQGEKAPAHYRKGAFSVEKMTDPKNLITFINKTRTLPLEAVDDFMVNKSYPAAVWLFRQHAMSGNYNGARALQLWLDWADKIRKLPKRGDVKNVNPKGSAQFLPRDPTGGEV